MLKLTGFLDEAETNVVDIPDIYLQGGIVVDDENSDAFAKAIVSLVGNNAARIDLAAKTRCYAE